MLSMYTGTPGSGKTMHATQLIIDALVEKKVVVSNYPLSFKKYKRLKTSRFYYVPNEELTPDFLVELAERKFKAGKESQGLIVIDEASILFNCREYAKNGRARWVSFMQQHRHWGWDVILITQYDKMIDKQVRALAEYEVIHRRFDRMGLYGLLFRLLHIPVFVAVSSLYQMRMRVHTKFFFANRRVCTAYNSWETKILLA